MFYYSFTSVRFWFQEDQVMLSFAGSGVLICFVSSSSAKVSIYSITDTNLRLLRPSLSPGIFSKWCRPFTCPLIYLYSIEATSEVKSGIVTTANSDSYCYLKTTTFFLLFGSSRPSPLVLALLLVAVSSATNNSPTANDPPLSPSTNDPPVEI